MKASVVGRCPGRKRHKRQNTENPSSRATYIHTYMDIHWSARQNLLPESHHVTVYPRD